MTEPLVNLNYKPDGWPDYSTCSGLLACSGSPAGSMPMSGSTSSVFQPGVGLAHGALLQANRLKCRGMLVVGVSMGNEATNQIRMGMWMA
eukprot:CAMPEP_0119109258 /NCGR_PEP_ID=MMETSP1180-20130426/17811_1 /TAXON_ID=3052 ORGANISM="Chlamydomonas cf sp, Strain CCMP681" /NCGR_SAMPLE_ID=MMETSP1180 /ASSEMBLY_ACC=CAM_ASM_000741 /LENGTH=89 /DNA_ID=CAMNT_0007094997 /DNA_START=1031 /DNA_END=1300 /DNA_ORIENTATION=+